MLPVVLHNLYNPNTHFNPIIIDYSIFIFNIFLNSELKER